MDILTSDRIRELSKFRQKLLDILYGYFSSYLDGNETESAIKEVFITCYDDMMKDRFIILSEFEYILKHFRENDELSDKEVRELLKNSQKWILFGLTNGSVEYPNELGTEDERTLYVDTYFDQLLNSYGLDLNEARESIYQKEDAEINIKRLYSKKIKMWNNPKSVKRGRKVKRKTAGPVIYQEEEERDPNYYPKGHGVSYISDKVPYKMRDQYAAGSHGAVAASSSRHVKDEALKKQLQRMADPEDQTWILDQENFDSLFSNLGITDESKKTEIKNLWREIVKHSRGRQSSSKKATKKGSLKNREIFQLYTIKLVIPSITYDQLYYAFKDSFPKDIKVDQIYNSKTNVPSDIIHTHFEKFFNSPKNTAISLGKYIKRHGENISPKYNFDRLFSHINDSYETERKVERNEIVPAKPAAKSHKFAIINKIKEFISDEDRLTPSKDRMATQIASIIRKPGYNTVKYFKITKYEDGEPYEEFYKIQKDLIKQII